MPINIEAIIKAAIEKGEFDKLPGQGKPLPEDQFKDLPDEIRMTYRVLKNAGYAPSEVNIKKSIQELKLKIGEEEDPDKKSQLLIQIQKLEAELEIKIQSLRK